MCKATLLVRFAIDTAVIGFDVIHKIFSSVPTRKIERIFLKFSHSVKDCNLLIRLLREMYLVTLSRR